MKTGTFMDIIDAHYKDIVSLFKSRLYKIEKTFDEDVFNDSFIKCAQRFGNNTITYDDAVKYFWIAYINTVKGVETKRLNHPFESIDIMDYDCIDENEHSYAQYIYNIVMSAITEAFNEDDMMIYSLYKYHGWTEKELADAGYDCKNIDIRIILL